MKPRRPEHFLIRSFGAIVSFAACEFLLINALYAVNDLLFEFEAGMHETHHTVIVIFSTIVSVAFALWYYEYYAVSDEVSTRCRRCGYLLRGLREPRCSECGERI